MDRDRDQPRLLLEGDGKRRPDLAELAGAGEDERGSDIRVTCKRDFSLRREDSDVPRMTGLRRKYERALGEVELPRDLLHLLVREASRVGQDRQWIPTEPRLGEHVTRVVAVVQDVIS